MYITWTNRCQLSAFFFILVFYFFEISINNILVFFTCIISIIIFSIFSNLSIIACFSKESAFSFCLRSSCISRYFSVESSRLHFEQNVLSFLFGVLQLGQIFVTENFSSSSIRTPAALSNGLIICFGLRLT